MLGDEAVDGGLEIDDRGKNSAFQPSFGESSEEALDGVEPGTGRRCEVKGEARVPVEPFAHLGMFVRGIIVEDHMHALAGGRGGIDGVQENDELLMPVAGHVSPDHRAIEDVERGEQRCGAVAFVIMGHRAKPPFLERQTRLGPVKRLDLALSVEGRDDGMGGRIDIESDRVMEFIREAGIVGDILQLLDAPGECDLPRFAKGGALG